MQLQQDAQALEIVLAGGGQIEPKELVTLEPLANPPLVDRSEARHHKPKLIARRSFRRCYGLADCHHSLLLCP
jgi:hypothetical protein